MAPKAPHNFRRIVGKACGANLMPSTRPVNNMALNNQPPRPPTIHIPGFGEMTFTPSGTTTSSLETHASSSGIIAQQPTPSDLDTSSSNTVVARSDAPVVKRPRRASIDLAMAAAQTSESRQNALEELEWDKTANSARAARSSTWATWIRLHKAWFGEQVNNKTIPPHPRF